MEDVIFLVSVVAHEPHINKVIVKFYYALLSNLNCILVLNMIIVTRIN